MIKTFKIFSMAAMALMMAACSSEDAALNNSTAQQQGRKVQFTATIAAPNSGAGTRTEYTEGTASSGEAARTADTIIIRNRGSSFLRVMTWAEIEGPNR